MKPNVLSWNVHKLDEMNKRLRIRYLLRYWKVDIACLQETKLELVSRTVVHNL